MKRIKRKVPRALPVPQSIHHVWSMDFMHDQLGDGCNFRLFIVLGDFIREHQRIDADISLPSNRWAYALWNRSSSDVENLRLFVSKIRSARLGVTSYIPQDQCWPPGSRPYTHAFQQIGTTSSDREGNCWMSPDISCGDSCGACRCRAIEFRRSEFDPTYG